MWERQRDFYRQLTRKRTNQVGNQLDSACEKLAGAVGAAQILAGIAKEVLEIREDWKEIDSITGEAPLFHVDHFNWEVASLLDALRNDLDFYIGELTRARDMVSSSFDDLNAVHEEQLEACRAGVKD